MLFAKVLQFGVRPKTTVNTEHKKEYAYMAKKSFFDLIEDSKKAAAAAGNKIKETAKVSSGFDISRYSNSDKETIKELYGLK